MEMLLIVNTASDGGLGHNNPVLHLIEEAERIYPLDEIGCMISIGTGVQQGLKLAADGTVRQSMLGLPLIGKVAAKVDAAIVAAALATSTALHNQNSAALESTTGSTFLPKQISNYLSIKKWVL
jgi:hypothetical protein